MWIYLLTNTVNGKRYIGQTHVDPNVRFSQHRKSSRYISSRRRYIIARAIHKHGWENFKAEVIEKCKSQDELDARERHFIEQYGCIAPYGYNADLGGRGRGRVSDLTKLKIGIANAGKVLSASTREKYPPQEKASEKCQSPRSTGRKLALQTLVNCVARQNLHGMPCGKFAVRMLKKGSYKRS